MTKRWVLVFGLLCSACGSDEPADDGLGPTDSSVQVMTRNGVVHGALQGSTRRFLGIPYGKAPVGELRWRAPEPAEPWEGELETTAFGPACKQPALAGSSEDCLSLNVWTHDVSLDDPGPLKPVMVWLHGGAFLVGSNSLYDGVHLVERGDVVLVAVNYRLGAFGFLAHPALTQDPNGRGSSGNYGIEDQALALRWVKDNIRAFGGDPNNVTLFGESAGSACTCVLLATPAAQGLVDRAIMESGVCLGFETNLADAEAMGEETAAALDCEGADALACLRGKDADQIVSASSDLLGALLQQRWRPILDGVVVPALTDIQPVKVPIILGTNRNEGGQFGILASTENAFRSRVNGYYPNPDHANVVFEQYSAEINGSWANAFSAMATDGLFVCPTRRLARVASAEVDVYVYSFNHGNAHHADEVQYVFGLPGLSADAQIVSDQMLTAWTTFARTGNPNAEGANPTWPKYDPESDEHMVFDVTPSIASGLKRDVCDALDTLPALQF